MKTEYDKLLTIFHSFRRLRRNHADAEDISHKGTKFTKGSRKALQK